MASKGKHNPTAAYSTGSWYTYSMQEYSGPDFLTAGAIARGMKVFEQRFKMEMEVVSGSQLLFWTLTLERHHQSRITRSQQKIAKRVTISTYKFAVNSEEQLLFCNKLISLEMQRQLSKALSCTRLQMLKLTEGNPVNLLMMYQQTKKKAPGHLRLQHEDYLSGLVDKVQHCGLVSSEDLSQQMTDPVRNRVFESLGSHSDLIPCLQRVSLAITNMPTQQPPPLHNQCWSKVEAEICASSLFHLYREIGMLELISNIPPWLQSTRTSNKPKVHISFE